MTKANGTAHCRASASCPIGWINRSRPVTSDLALAILSAFVEAQRVSAPMSRTSVPSAPLRADTLYEPICSDNFA
jgi:hypothetical protein